MKLTRIASAMVFLSLTGMFSLAGMLTPTGKAYAQSSSSESAATTERVENGVPIAKLIAVVAKKTGKKFILDPKVHGDAEIVGQDTSNISYGDLLTILHDYGFTAAEYGGYVNVVPDPVARQLPLPIITGKETRPDTEYVTKVITVKNVSAAQLVPILRPMIPQNGHLAAYPCTNKLILVDTFANVQRLNTVIEALDVGEPYKQEKCEPREFPANAGPGTAPAAPREPAAEHR
jgi:general secretion pathway protein D